MSFSIAITYLLQKGVEGVRGEYSNDPSDPGKGTVAGVTQETYNQYRVEKGFAPQDIRLIIDIETDEIYRKTFWDLAHCEEIDSAGKPNLAIVHFDTAVQRGPHRSITMLQNLLSETPDGIWGARTFHGVSICNEEAMVFNYLEARKAHYLKRLIDYPPAKNDIHGWMLRLKILSKTVNSNWVWK
jgi:lysozyme family protein